MATVARKIGEVFHVRCITCGKHWVSEEENGGAEKDNHKH